jgi:hypothetical protein
LPQLRPSQQVTASLSHTLHERKPSQGQTVPYEEISVSYLRCCSRDSALVLAHTFGRSCLWAYLPAAQDAQHLRLLLREFKTINI